MAQRNDNFNFAKAYNRLSSKAKRIYLDALLKKVGTESFEKARTNGHHNPEKDRAVSRAYEIVSLVGDYGIKLDRKLILEAVNVYIHDEDGKWDNLETAARVFEGAGFYREALELYRREAKNHSDNPLSRHFSLMKLGKLESAYLKEFERLKRLVDTKSLSVLLSISNSPTDFPDLDWHNLFDSADDLKLNKSKKKPLRSLVWKAYQIVKHNRLGESEIEQCGCPKSMRETLAVYLGIPQRYLKIKERNGDFDNALECAKRFYYHGCDFSDKAGLYSKLLNEDKK